MNKVRALSVDIYESKNIGNCSNDGISNRFRTAYIICPDGNWEFDLDDPENLPENLVKAVTKHYSFGTFTHAEPIAHPGRWWMMGGAFIYTCDSRFREYFGDSPMALHDRYEG
ncbi:MAG: hypothetical protein IJT36_08940 [Alphaproteobacteria bacterium]|nr:hypothetical protein [Alphaproteobacteria bacterium]